MRGQVGIALRGIGPWTAGVVLVSISGHTLNALVSDPIEPWEGLAITALPMWGTLSLFVAAIAVSAPPVRRATETQRHRDDLAWSG